MKKVLALFLAVLMVMSCMVFTVSAEAAPAPEFLPVSDADTIDGWKRDNPNATYSILTDGDQKQGEGAFAITLAGRQASNKVAAFEFTYSLAQPMDVSDMKTLVFDFYVEDADAIRMLRWDFMLYDAEHGAYVDRYRHFLKGKTMDEIAGAPIVDGWNRVEVDLAAMGKGYNGFSDLTKFTMIRFYSNENNGAGTQIEHGAFEGTLTLAIDNVYFKKADRATSSFSIPMLAVGASNQSSKPVSTAHNNNTDNGAGFRASTKMWSGGGFTTNLLNYNALEFDLYIDNAFANKVHYTLNFGTVTDFYQANVYMWSKTLEELAGYELKEGWNHVKIDLARFDAQRYENDSKRIDLNTVNFFSMFNDTSMAVGADTSDTLVTLNMANVMLTNNGSEFFTVSNFHAIRSGENYGYPSHTQTPNGWPNFKLSHGDIDGDGDDEWVLLNTTGAGATKFVSSDANMPTAGYALNLHSATTDFSDVTAISFDVYCAFGAADANLDPTDVTFELRLNNNTNFDWNARDSYHGLTVNLKEAEYLGNNWYRVKAPLSQWVKNTGVATAADKPGGGTPDLNDVNILRVLGMNSISYTDGFKFALDNLRFWTEEIVEETPVDNTRLLADFSGNGALGNFNTFAKNWPSSFYGAGTFKYTEKITSDGIAELMWRGPAATFGNGNILRSTIIDPSKKIADANGVTAGKKFTVTDYPEWLRDDCIDAIQFDLQVKCLSGMTDANGNSMDIKDLFFKAGLVVDRYDNWNIYYSTPFTVRNYEALGSDWYRVTIPYSDFAAILNSNELDIANFWGFTISTDVAENTGVVSNGNLGVQLDNLSVVLKSNWKDIIYDINLMNTTHEEWFHEKDPALSINNVTNTMNLNGDIDGDGNNEIIITNQTGAYENAPLSELLGFSDWAYHYNYQMPTDADAVQFRMLYAADGQALTDKNFTIWFVSVYKDYDFGATMKLTFTLDQYGERMGDTNWYLVTIPFSAFTVKNTTRNESAGKYTAGYEPNLNALGQIYVSAPAVSYENSYQVALADFQLTTMPVVEEPDSYIDFTGANLVLTNSFNFKFNANAVDANGLFATVDFNGQTTKVAPTLNGSTGKYEVNVNGIYAHQLAKGVTVTMWGLSSDGVMLKDAKANYSVKENLTNLIKNENSKYQLKDQTIAADALTYGQAAVDYSGWAMESIVDDTNRELVKAYASKTAFAPQQVKTVNGSYTEGAKWRGAKLILDNTVLVRFIFEATSVDGLSVNVTGLNRDSVVTDFTNLGDGTFCFDVPVYASEFDNVIKVAFAKDGDSYFINYSVNHYLARNYTAETTNTDAENLNNLLVAMYRYGVSAAAY